MSGPPTDESRPWQGGPESSRNDATTVTRATAYVDNRPEQPIGSYRDEWIGSATAHLTPLDPRRPWRLRQARRTPTPVAVLAPIVARTFRPPPGTVPQPRCSDICWRTHANDDLEATG